MSLGVRGRRSLHTASVLGSLKVFCLLLSHRVSIPQPADPGNMVLSLRDKAPSLKVPMAGSFFLPRTHTKVTCGCPMSIFLQAVPQRMPVLLGMFFTWWDMASQLLRERNIYEAGVGEALALASFPATSGLRGRAGTLGDVARILSVPSEPWLAQVSPGPGLDLKALSPFPGSSGGGCMKPQLAGRAGGSSRLSCCP